MAPVLIALLGLTASAASAQDPKGTELRINPRVAGAQWLPDVATGADGRFVVVWKEGGATANQTPVFVKARIYDAVGRPRSGEIQVARLAPNAFGGPKVAMAPNGRFVVVWGGGVENPGIVFGRRFTAGGVPLGDRFQLAASTERGQDTPAVAMTPDGGFLTAWTQTVPGNAEVNTDVFLRRFGADGRPLGPETPAIGGFEEQSEPRLAVRSNGDFIVVCQTYSGEGLFYDVLARRFARSGTPLGDAFLVNGDGEAPELSQLGPSVAMAADGRFAIAWTDLGIDFGRDPSLHETEDYTGIGVRFFNAAGAPLGPPLAANIFLRGAQEAPAISALQTGGFLLVWASGAGQDNDGFGIFARVFGADGQPRARELRINLNRTGSQTSPALSLAPNGKGAAVWYGPDGNGTGIFSRLIGPPA
jgi:hypothetical protein